MNTININKTMIFENITVITPENDSVSVYKDCFVVVSSGVYKYVGKSKSEAIKSLDSKEYESYNGSKKILMPVYVNSHTHLAMTLMRNRADDESLHDWLYNTIFPLEAELRPEDLNNGTLLGIAEMIMSGTGACANMYVMDEKAMDTDIAAQTGIKLNTVISGGLIPFGSDKYINDEKHFNDVYDKYNNSSNGRIKCGLLVHSVYLYDEQILYKFAEMAQNKGAFIHTHLSETKKEVTDCLEKYNLTPAAAMNKFGIFNVPALAAHCVYLSEEDLEILSMKNVSVAHNPVSNLKLGSGIADINRIIDKGINVAIGTDGPASNNTLDMVQDIRFAAYLAKGIQNDPCAITAAQTIRMATINGMKAIGFNDSGEVREGWKADLQIIDTDNAHMSPLGDPLSAVVYSMKSSDVESLMIDGKMLMHKRTLMTIDIEKAIYEAERSSEYLYNKVAK